MWHFIVSFLAGVLTSVAGLFVGLIVVGGVEELGAGELPPDALLAFSVPAQIIGNMLAIFVIATVLLKVSVHKQLIRHLNI